MVVGAGERRVPALRDRTCVALGVFDGVHRGHQHLIGLARDHAQRLKTQVVAATFWPHPQSVVRGITVPLLCSLEQRIERLHAAGADYVRVIPFDAQLSELSADDFIEQWLVRCFAARVVVVGEGFRFGHEAKGNVETLRTWQADSEHHFATVAANIVEVDGNAVSSSRIRAALAAGSVAEAAALLGRPVAYAGEVVHGARRGRTLGFPTANVAYDGRLALPADGVYAGSTTIDGVTYAAAISVGTNPQFAHEHGQPERSLEAYLLDYNQGDALYGRQLALQISQHLRGQAVFTDVEELIAAIAADVQRVRTLVDVGAPIH